MTRLPVWRRSDGTEYGRLDATSCSLDLSVNDTPRATISIPATDTIPNTHDFVELFTEHGSAGVFRVVSSTFKYSQSCQMQLIGAVDTLSDDIWPATLDESTKSATEWIRQILSKQTTTRWTLGTCAMATSVKIKVNYGDLWSLLEEVRNSRSGYCWAYDYSTTPWKISLVQMPNTVTGEFRVTRNVESAQITVSDQEMVNRLVFTVTDGNSDGTPVITTYNNTQSQAKYGIRTRCTDIKTEELPVGMSASQYAQQLLAEHAVPDFSISITGADLSRLTGMSVDHIELGYMCNVILPEYGETVTERVVGLSYPDALNEPMRIRVTLSTELGRITGSIASAKRIAQAVKASRGGGSKADKDSWAKVLTDVIEATDGTGIKEMWQSGIQMNSHGGVRLFSLYQGLSSLDSEINITNSAINSEVTRATAEEGRLSSRITQTAEAITLKVSKGDVSTQLAVECGNVSITGGNLTVDGYVTASQLSTTNARITNLLNGTTVADELRATNARLGNSSGGVVYIYGQQVRVYSVVDTSGNTHHVYGYT